MEKQVNFSFADLAVEHRRVKSVFFEQINTILDWSSIEDIIKCHYNKGKSVTGRESYSGLLLFKITLLQTWYSLSDYEVEDQVKDRISFSKFVGIPLGDDVPDHSVISRFRTALTNANAYELLFEEINKQLEMHGILVRTGAIVDATITDTPRKPRGKKTYEAVEDRNEEEEKSTTRVVEKVQSHVDQEANWIVKNNKPRYGYKNHSAVDDNGLVVGVVTTAANESDISNFEPLINKVPLAKGARVKGDKGYKSEKNDKLLKEKGLKNGIMHKAQKGKPLSKHKKRFNEIVSKTRYRVERTFGSIRLLFSGGTARYIGLAKTHTQHLIQSIAYNLYRSPGIIASNCKNQMNF